MNESNPGRSTPLSRRRFLRDMTLGAAALGAGARPLAAQIAEITKGGERRPGVAIMGLGLYARGEIGPGLAKAKLCRFAGVVTGSREKGQAWSRKYGFPEGNVWNYDQIGSLAGNPDVDIVYVVTPNGLHAEHTIRLAEAGKHVICEKPMALTAAEAETMLAACRKANVMLSIGYRLHYDLYHAELDRLARDKDFGTLARLSGEHSWVFTQRAWRIEKKLSGGGPLMDVGIYVIQAACRAALSQPVAVTARELPKTNPELFNEVEEAIEWSMEFPGGVECRGTTSYARNGNFFRAEGDHGWLRLDPAYAYRGIRATTSRGPLSFPAVAQQTLHMDDFAAGVLAGRQSPVPGEMGRDHMRIIDAIYDSAAHGGRRTLVSPA
jgi:glucose-fructose oxidoreductase